MSGKKKYVRGKRTNSKLTAPGRTVWVVRTGRRGWEEVERVCSDRHETCTLYLQLLEPDHLYVISTRFWRSLVPQFKYIQQIRPRSGQTGMESRGDWSKPARLLTHRVSQFSPPTPSSRERSIHGFFFPERISFYRTLFPGKRFPTVYGPPP